MAVVLVISLYTSRVILNTLGVDDYGVYNVVAGFVSMFGFLCQLSRPVCRDTITLKEQKEVKKDTQKYM